MKRVWAWLLVPFLLVSALSAPRSAGATFSPELEGSAFSVGRAENKGVDSIPSDQLEAVELYATEVGVSVSTAWRMLLQRGSCLTMR